MARGGTKFPLIVYRHLLNRWWTPMIAIGLGMFGMAYLEYSEPLGPYLVTRWLPYTVTGLLAIGIGIFFLIIRYVAYVQAFPGYLKFVTPFLRFNISYKRIQRTTTNEMRQLFPPQSMSGWIREIFAPLASQTAVVLELKGFPLSPFILRLFLSRFFFKDKTPHIVILVQDWMKFITELDSMRMGGGDSMNQPPARRSQRNSILTKLPQK
jgi:hypothetical protein